MAVSPTFGPLPAPFEQAFLDDCPYDPEVLLFDRLDELAPDRSLVRCRWPTHAELPFTRSQRVHPVRHPRHVSGSLIVHATGMLGFVHAYYLLGLRHAEGWVGYGTHIHEAKFRKLVEPGEPIDCAGEAVRIRRGRSRYVVRYRFEFRHLGGLCYQSEQTAVWTKVALAPTDEVHG